jgi:hypothetical protein
VKAAVPSASVVAKAPDRFAAACISEKFGDVLLATVQPVPVSAPVGAVPPSCSDSDVLAPAGAAFLK